MFTPPRDAVAVTVMMAMAGAGGRAVVGVELRMFVVSVISGCVVKLLVKAYVHPVLSGSVK